MFWPLSATEPIRSAVPLAATGIMCLGLFPIIGGPDQPLHWAVAAGMVGFGALLAVRHGLGKRVGALRDANGAAAQRTGSAVLGVCGVIASIIVIIVVARWRQGGGIAALSVAMPLTGLLWLATLGIQVSRHRSPASEAPATDRPSRRPPNWDAAPSPKSGSGTSPNRHVSV